MAVYAITGKLGGGKGKAGVMRAREYLRAGKRVATNCDLFLEHLLPPDSKLSITRIPDKPSASDLYAIGSGNKYVEFDPIYKSTPNGFEFTAPSPKLLKGFDESHNGMLLLDECGSWLNTRNFQDKGRAGLLEWAIHARKYGWDVYFITQNIKQIDAQLKESLFEYVVRLNRLDRMKIPFVSSVMKFLTAGVTDGSLPRVHIGVVRLGISPDGLVADRWVFRGDDLNNAYNTTQVFSDTYPHAIHSVLSSWHLSAKVGTPKNFIGPLRPGWHDKVLIHPRKLPPKPPHKHMTKFLSIACLLGVLLGAFGDRFLFSKYFSVAKTEVEKTPPKFSETISGRGYFLKNGSVTVLLSDGRVVTPLTFKTSPSGFEAQINDTLWVRGVTQ